MKHTLPSRRTLALLALVLPLAALLAYVALRSGPLAPIAVTEQTVPVRALQPAIFGIGTVQARQTHKIGPTAAGRLLRLRVDVGDTVHAGQVLGEMDAVDLQERIRALQAARQRAEAAIREAQARQNFAHTQAQRYDRLWTMRAVSEEQLLSKRQELAVADALLASSREESLRLQAETAALRRQQGNLQLRAATQGIVSAREAEPGSTVVAGQSVLEVLAPESLWVHVRVDQSSAQGLAAGLPAHIRLRSRAQELLAGQVLRIEPRADSVTEEMLLKVVFTQVPQPLPPLGELAEVTIDLPTLPATPVVPNAAIARQGQQLGVWQRTENRLRFMPLTLGRADLQGQVQVLSGLQEHDAIIVHSEKVLAASSRVHTVPHLLGGAP